MGLYRKIILSALTVALSCSGIFAQLHLSNIYCRAVKEGISVGSSVDSLLIETTAGNGIATTRMTLVITPNVYGMSGVCVDTLGADCQAAKKLDSIEINLSMSLPVDFVAQNLYLWVNGEPQRAFIQDRALAQGQYQEVVGKRKDPALLETYGNGYYNLRIFPAKSLESRKVAIEFQHTFTDDSLGLITATLPFEYTFYGTNYGAKLDFVRAQFSSTDNKNYHVVMDGLGEGFFNRNKSLVLETEKADSLKQGKIATQDLSNEMLYAWSGIDKIDNFMNMGFKVALSESTVTLEPEPTERIFVLDVRNDLWDWNSYYSQSGKMIVNGNETISCWSRAQKLAIIGLKQYVAKNQKFNLIIQGEKPVFDKPVLPTAENLSTAYKAILNASPSHNPSTMQALQTAISQISDGLIIMISDIYPPSNYVYDASQKTGKEQNMYDALIDSIRSVFDSSDVSLFTISDDYNLNSIATNSGGFNLTGLRWYWRYYWYYSTTSFVASELTLPPLFGSRQGISDVQIVGSADLKDVVWSFEEGYSRIMLYDIFLAEPQTALAKKLSSVSTWQNSATLQVSGKIQPYSSRAVFNFVISGKLGGLKFTKEVSAAVDHYSLAQKDNVMWAYCKANNLSKYDYFKNADSIKQIGKMYNIVTQQTSLLALEPGMELWEDTIAESQINNATSIDMATADTKMASNIQDNAALIDNVTLESLIADVSPVKESQAVKKGQFMVRALSSGVEITLPSEKFNGFITLAIFDLNGRLVVSKKVTARDFVGQKYLWKFSTQRVRLSQGCYTLFVRGDSYNKNLRLPMMGR